MAETTQLRRDAPVAIDLFAGAGFLSAAIKDAGFKMSLAVERDPIAATTYRRNVGDHVVVGDIRGIDPQGRCDILAAGPPCQGFSTLNRNRHNDERRLLALEVLPWVKACEPKIVLIENVAAFAASDACREIVAELTNLGYEIQSAILDAAEFGVPQHRKRFFLIGSRIGQPQWPEPCSRRTTVREAWDGLSVEPDGLNAHIAPKPSALALERMQVIPTNGDRRSVVRNAPHLAPPSWFRLGCDVTDVWGRLAWDRPSNTLRTCLQNPSKGRYIHPESHRVMTLREAARLQTIGDDWQFAGVPAQVARQIGNGVPYLLGKQIAGTLIEML